MLINLLILSVAVFLVANFLPGIQVKHFGTAVIVAIVYSLVNFFFRWLLIVLSLPFIIITFGLFKLVINAVLLWITDKIIEDFEIENVTTTIVASLLITFCNLLLRWLF